MRVIKKECSYILNEIKNITNQLSKLNNNQKLIDQTINVLNLKANLNILSAQVKEPAGNTEKHITPLLKEKIQLNIKNAILLKDLSFQAFKMRDLVEGVDQTAMF
ncbi:hypothetical protein [Candidatus Williamhamiltonella defendens]|uniref:hypothetical protein n=1 Tax=Candidatus Williamhamiltonella defendens TaxID=138072 RepID=UPI00130E57B5|nr:hypothetical protein [Candidatus Hamiltonella defensa]